MSSVPTFVMMVGIAAAGKTTKAVALGSQYRYLSSDELREELYGDINDQTHNQEVFAELHKRVRETLRRGESVAYDATNLSIKDRRCIMSQIERIPSYKVAYVFTTPADICKTRNFLRERIVPEWVIDHQVKKFQFPLIGEGFDEILVEEPPPRTPLAPEDLLVGFDQKNFHHPDSLFVHSAKVVELVKQNAIYDPVLTQAAWWHDVGKLWTQSFDDDGVAHYYSHENVGAYTLMSKGQNLEFFKEFITLVNYHMLPFNWGKDSTKEKYRKLMGNELFEKLLALHEADIKSTK